MSKIVLSIENLSKQYRLGKVGTGTLSHDLNRFWAKIRGKEDPFSMVGQVNNRSKASSSDYVWALKDINFKLSEGKVLGIIGKNGAGKSTLLKLISRVTAPTHGFIKTKGRIASLLEVGTGMHPEMTARENIYLNGAILGMKRLEISKKFDAIVDFAGCAMYIDTPVKRYSSGMRVRLGFAVAAFLEPEILIVDEVLAVGDAEFQKKAVGKMKDISEDGGRTVLFVSHNMSSVKMLCERAILLHQGQLVHEDTAAKAVEYYLQNSFLKQRVAQSNKVELKEGPNCIHSIEIENNNTNILVDSTKLSFLFKFHIGEDPRGVDLNISFFSTNSEKLFMYFGKDLIDSESFESGENIIRLNLPEHVFNKGSYYINVALHRNYKEVFHAQKEAFLFEIEENDYRFNKYAKIPTGFLNIPPQK